MIPLAKQWCIQIDVTNTCFRRCSNCTRLIGQVRDPFYMSVNQYERAVGCLADFPTDSPPAEDPTFKNLKCKVVGMIGGEPLMHPNFTDLVRAAEVAIPERRYRGLWTGMVWQGTIFKGLIERVFGYVNNNLHQGAVHTPVLTAISELMPDREEQRRLIDNCWLQRLWSGTITPRGLFLCEVMGAMDLLFDGPGGLPVEPGCWRRPLEDFQCQVDQWCYRCGVPLELPGRADSEEVDDVTPGNQMFLAHRERCHAHDSLPTGRSSDPWRYMR